MSNLISGKEAKLVWANGEQLQIAHLSMKEWEELDDNYSLSVFDNDRYVFRIKPKTITLNSIEVPAPFEPKNGEKYWIISDDYIGGYTSTNIPSVSIAAWRNEDEIRQVVAALRSVFKTN